MARFGRSFPIPRRNRPRLLGTGINLTLTVANVTTAAPALALTVGVNLTLPVSNVTTAAPALVTATGANLVLPVVNVPVGAPSLSVGLGVNVTLPVVNVPVAAPALTVLAGVGISLTLPRIDVPVAAPALRVVIQPHDHLFRPPTIKLRPPDPQGERLWIYFGLDYGISVLKNQDGSYFQTQYPSTDEINVAAAVYLGGHEYIVDDDEYASLVAAGYGPFFAEDNPDGTYGGGSYGIGPFGG